MILLIAMRQVGWPLKAGASLPANWTPSMHKDSWRALNKLKKDGVARAIGVSNFTAKHIAELVPKPDVNQVSQSAF